MLKSLKGPATARLFDGLNVLFMLVICFLMLYPVWYTLVVSFNEGMDAMRGGIFWWPRRFTLENYATVFNNRAIFTAYGVTVARTIIGTTLAVFFTAMVAFALTKRTLIGWKLYMSIGMITLFFSEVAPTL